MSDGIRVFSKGKRRDDEHQIQCAIVDEFRYSYPKFALALFAIPNGAAQTAIAGARFVREGLTAGVPDMLLAVPNKGFHGLFIEVKTPRGVVSDEQTKMMGLFTDLGYMCVVVRGSYEAKGIIDSYMSAKS